MDRETVDGSTSSYTSLFNSRSTSSQDLTQKIVLHVYDDESKEFTSLTTYHGMIRIYSSETWPSRIFWSLVVVTCLTLFMIHSGLILTFYHSHPTFLKMTNTDLDFKDLPSITICRVGGAKNWMNYPDLQSRPDIIGAFDSFLLDDPTDYQFTKLLEELDVLYQKKKNISFNLNSFLRETKNDCHNVITKLIIGDKKIRDPCYLAKETMTDVGYCHTISGWKFKSPIDTVKIDITSEDDESVMLQIHSHKSRVALKSNGIRVSRGMKVMVTVAPQKESFLENGNWGTCSRIWTEEAAHNNGIYDMTTCEKYCIAKQYIRNCNCVPFFHQILGVRICSLAESIHCKPIDIYTNDCRCPMECDRIFYNELHHSYLRKAIFERRMR